MKKGISVVLLLVAVATTQAALDYNGNPINKGGSITITPRTSSAIFANYTQAVNLDGLLDNTFGAGGTVLTTIGAGGNARGYAVALQQDGKIVVAGYANDNGVIKFAVARYTTQGILDSTFGTGLGYVLTPIGTGRDAEGYAVALQQDGKIVVSGFASDGAYKFAVARYTTEGILDSTFGTGGIVLTTIGAGAYGYAVALQQDGKIVVAGYAADGAYKFAVARYTTNGILDSTFGTGLGYVLTTIGTGGDAEGYAVALQQDGKILVAGFAPDGFAYKIAVARYTTQGTLDFTFGTGGTVLTTIGTGGDAYGYAVALQQDGKILVAGYANDGAHNKFAVARYTTNGILDSTFGTGLGYVLTTIGTGGDAYGYAVALQQDGKILVAGYANDGAHNKFAVARYTTNGILDSTFGTGLGYVLTTIGTGGDAEGYAVALQQDGKIVVAGYASDGFNKFAVARYINPFTLATFTASYGSVGLV